MRKPLISIVVPVYNEETNILPFYAAVTAVTDQLAASFDFEFVFTDNHSLDSTFALLQQLAAQDSRVHAFRFSRNFGFQRSIMTGYTRARGDAAIQLDVDLQDPPELIANFIEEWQAGADVVYGVRIKRQESWIINVQRVIFYRLIDRLSEEKIPVDAGDFRLISRRVIDPLNRLPKTPIPTCAEPSPRIGFEQVGIEYARSRPAIHGESKFPFSKLMSLAHRRHPEPLHRAAAPFATYFGLAASRP